MGARGGARASRRAARAAPRGTCSRRAGGEGAGSGDLSGPRVVLFGSGSARPGEAAWEEARALGAALARRGLVLVNGGTGGAMEASARGAREAGGHVVGVVASRDGRTPNPWVSEAIDALTLGARQQRLLDLGEGYVWVGGGVGTLAELAAAWHVAPLPGFRSRPRLLLPPWPERMAELARALGAGEGWRELFAPARDAEEAAARLARALGGRGRAAAQRV